MHKRRAEIGGLQNAAREAEIEGRTRSLWPSSIRIPRISVNGPLLPRPFGQCTVWVADMSPQIPHILRRMGLWCCRAQPTGIRLVTATRYGPCRYAFLSLSARLYLSSSCFLLLSFSLRNRGKLHPSDGYTRMAAVFLPHIYTHTTHTYIHNGSMHLSIPIYLFAQEQRFLFPQINVQLQR